MHVQQITVMTLVAAVGFDMLHKLLQVIVAKMDYYNIWIVAMDINIELKMTLIELNIKWVAVVSVISIMILSLSNVIMVIKSESGLQVRL